MKHKNLKWGVFESEMSEENFERYIIENEADLNAFIVKFPQIKKLGIEEVMRNSLAENRIIIASDNHSLSKFPTYCYESIRGSDDHISSIYRVSLGE